MALIIDDDFSGDEFHYVVGTKGGDRIVGNGSAVIMIGGNGADELNPGIVDPAFIGPGGFSALLYGDGVRPGFGHPLSGTYGFGVSDERGWADVLHIGDDATLDALGALNAGMQAAWLNRSDALWPHEMEPQVTLTHLGELVELLRSDSLGRVP